MDILDGNYKPRKDQNKPVGIDIFVFDRVGSFDEAKRILYKSQRYKHIYVYSKFNSCFKKSDSPKSILKKIPKKACYYLGRLTFGGLTRRAYKKYLQICKDSQGDYVIAYDSWNANEALSTFCKYQDLFPLLRVPFEQIEVLINHNYDACLRNTYGDYMTIPPEEKRSNHPPTLLDFGD